jgi:ribosomal protein S18 acetylase RimI-like enzyme
MQASNLHTIEKARQHAQQYPETGPNVRYLLEPGSYLRHLLDPSVLTLGSVHHAIARICLDMGIVRQEFPGLEAELNTFVFKVSNLPQTRSLPEGLRWGRMREQDMEIVQARTSIPRPKKTLLALESVGVFDERTDNAVAWAFLGVDGSLTTLHTEPEYRGKGIAKAVAARIFREYAPELALDDEGTAWAYGNVYVGNVQSEAVCRSLGGESMWKTFWIRIGLRKPKA